MSITQTSHQATMGDPLDPVRYAIESKLAEALRAAGGSALGVSEAAASTRSGLGWLPMGWW